MTADGRGRRRRARPRDLRSHAAAGTVAGQRWHWAGGRDGETLVEIETLWTVGNEYPKHWPKPQHGWTLTIEGEPSMRTHFLSLASFDRDAPMLEHVNAANVATGDAGAQRGTRGMRGRAGFATTPTCRRCAA